MRIFKLGFLLSFGVFSGVAFALPQIYWPGYINNERCLYKASIGEPSECGEEYFSSMANGGKPTYESSGGEWIKIFEDVHGHLGAGGAGSTSALDRIEVQTKVLLDLSKLDQSRIDQLNKENGLPLATTNGLPTPYWLKGFGAGSAGSFRVEYQKCDRQDESPFKRPCKLVDKTWYLLGDFTFDEVTKDDGQWGKVIYLKKTEGIWGLKVTSGDPRFRLGFRGQVDSDVRSVYLPGIRMPTHISGKNKDGKTIYHRFDYAQLRQSTQARLNHRKCSLKADPNQLQFGAFYINKDQVGRIGQEKSTTLKLTCNTLTESLAVGGHRGDGNPQGYENKDIKGNRVIHTVKSLKISPTYPVQINNKQQIGLQLEGTKEIASNLYIEGSLYPAQECGQNALSVGLNVPDGTKIPKQIKNNPVENDNIPEYNFTTIYWKACKKAGMEKAGSYKGNAIVTIEYQ